MSDDNNKYTDVGRNTFYSGPTSFVNVQESSATTMLFFQHFQHNYATFSLRSHATAMLNFQLYSRVTVFT